MTLDSLLLSQDPDLLRVIRPTLEKLSIDVEICHEARAVADILNGKRTNTQEAFGMGANFVLQKPISTLNASRCFHAALNFMLKERRRYFRQPVKMQVKVVLEGKTLNATSTNIS